MGKGQKPSWTCIFGIVIQLYFASVLATSEVAFHKDGVDPNYASLLKECKKIKLPNGTMIQTVPKLLQTPLVTACSTWKSKYGPPLTQAVCRLPDCLSNPCQNGWCEETLQGYQCLCFPGFRGKHCAERWTLPTDGTTVSSSDSSQSATSPTSTSDLPKITIASTGPTDATTITPWESALPGTSPTSTSESTAATYSTTVTPSDSTLQLTFPASTSGPPTTTASTAPITDATTITPSDSTLQATSPTSTSSLSSPTSTTASSASTDETTMTPSDSTLPATSPTLTSGPPTTTGSTAPTDATTITPSDSTLPATSATSTSSLSTTMASSAPTDATTINPSDSALPVTSSTTTGSSAKVFVSDIDVIFVSDLQDELNFTSIPSTSSPYYIKYDPTERHIYWSDWDDYCVYRANLNGTDRERITAAGANDRPYGIAIAKRSRILYVAYANADKVTSMSIERGSALPGTETDFVNQDVNSPISLAVDEEEGFLYISRARVIVRALLNSTNDIEEIYMYHNTGLALLTGLSIDLTKNPRRVFFFEALGRTFYKDLSSPPNSELSIAIELTNYTHPYQENLKDINYFDGILYWVKGSDPMGIGIMTDYDQTNRSYRVQEIGQFQDPRRIFITSIEP